MSEHHALISSARAELDDWKKILMAHDLWPVSMTAGELGQLLVNYGRVVEALEQSIAYAINRGADLQLERNAAITRAETAERRAAEAEHESSMLDDLLEQMSDQLKQTLAMVSSAIDQRDAAERRAAELEVERDGWRLRCESAELKISAAKQ